MPSKRVGRDAVLSDCLYTICSHINSAYFKINFAFICFILQLQIILTVLQYLNHYGAS